MRIAMPLPDQDFDVTEVAVPWALLRRAGVEVVFATETGAPPACDPLLLTGVVFGQLGARPDAIAHYRALEQDAAFTRPVRWTDLDPRALDGLVLAGGHAPGMRQYLEGAAVQRLAATMWTARQPIGAICHGVIVLARALDPASGRSVLHGHRTTCLPAYMERSAYLATFWRRGRYYRTYPAYVEHEVTAALAAPTDFVRGPRTLSKRGTETDDTHAFVVEDGHYVSARWPGDAYLFARRFLARLALAAPR